jgi:hypothetical protein
MFTTPTNGDDELGKGEGKNNGKNHKEPGYICLKPNQSLKAKVDIFVGTITVAQRYQTQTLSL